jgi:acyl carrier protein
METINGRLIHIMAQLFDIESSSITDETSPDVVDKWDSMQHLLLTMELEEEFQVSFTTDEVVEMLSVGAIKSVLRKRGFEI